MKHTFPLLPLILLYLLPSAVRGGASGSPFASACDTLHVDSLAAPLPGTSAWDSISVLDRLAESDSISPDSLATLPLPADSAGVDSLAADSDSALAAVPLPQRVADLLDNEIFERTQMGIYVYDLTADTLVFARGERQCMRPASNEKLLTAVAALRSLGGGYLYRTRLYADGAVCDTDSIFRGRVYVRGGFDPLLDGDDLRAFADSLVAAGVTRVSSPVCFDLSFKDDKLLGWGWCWDDDLTPLTPLLFKGKDTFAERFRSALRAAGVQWDGTVEERDTPAGARLLATRTHTIDQVLLPMLKQSDNLMAESLFYQLAAQSGRKGAGRRQAAARVEALICAVGLDPSHYQVADGSGLSLYNYATPELLGRVLCYAYRHEEIYRHLFPALPIAGADGSLRRRMRGSAAAGNVRAKTGTVEGVSTLAGYCTAASGNTLCFAIMNQGIRHTSTGRNFQDRVCRALCR